MTPSGRFSFRRARCRKIFAPCSQRHAAVTFSGGSQRSHVRARPAPASRPASWQSVHEFQARSAVGRFRSKTRARAAIASALSSSADHQTRIPRTAPISDDSISGGNKRGLQCPLPACGCMFARSSSSSMASPASPTLTAQPSGVAAERRAMRTWAEADSGSLDTVPPANRHRDGRRTQKAPIGKPRRHAFCPGEWHPARPPAQPSECHAHQFPVRPKATLDFVEHEQQTVPLVAQPAQATQELRPSPAMTPISP